MTNQDRQNETKKITDHVKAQAAIAHLISEGWKIDLYHLKQTLPGGIRPMDWLEIANHCLNYCFDELAKEKVIPIKRFKR